jgi:hypothetical protein
MRQDLEELLELQRRTKAGEVAPLVDVAIKHFWLWPGKAYRAYLRRNKIAIEQLELRKRMNMPKDERVSTVVSICTQQYADYGLPERCELFLHIAADDAWPPVVALLENDAVDDFGGVEFWMEAERRYGELTTGEMKTIGTFKTVGEVAEFLSKIASEGREKALPCKRECRLWRERVWWLFSMLCAFGFLWFVGHGIVKLVRWLCA